MKAKVFTILFIVAAIAELLGEAMVIRSVIYFAKPMLMILLMLLYRTSLKGQVNPFHKLILTAFFFAWMGDVLLMFSEGKEIYFLLGLASFLITHLLFAMAFIKSAGAGSAKGIVFTSPLILVPIIAYGAGLIYFLYDDLGEMRLPVIVYASAIMFMVITAVNRYGKVSAASFWMVLTGALLFMFSDSMIAINKFSQPFELARTLIMLTYIVGQYYIAIGCLQLHSHSYPDESVL